MDDVFTALENALPNFGFVGYNRLLDELRSAPAIDTYPPHDVKQVDEDRFVVEIAAAGFAPEEIEITVAARRITISGKKAPTDEKVKYVRRSIAHREFELTIPIHDHIIVDDEHVAMENGMIIIPLHVEIPENKRRRSFRLGDQPEVSDE